MKRQREYNTFIRQLAKEGKLPDDAITKLISINAKAAFMYLLPKIHKDLKCVRPIIANYPCFSYKILKIISKLIWELLSDNHFSRVKDEPHFVRIIKNGNSNGMVLTADVHSLFTNTPLDCSIRLASDLLSTNNTD
ncbi:hypothetical protein GJ496_010741 [Pomphorhynchus laevis]|nr:hypothetical protein GJ496_010741 [Pomphorhynchus laevis]